MSKDDFLFIFAFLGALGAIAEIIHLTMKIYSMKAAAPMIAGKQTPNKPPPQTKLPLDGLHKKLLVVVILCVISLGLSSYGYYRQGTFGWHDVDQEEIVGKIFRNETVVLDGKKYIRCKFKSVTFQYNGTAAFSFIQNEVADTVLIKTQNPGIYNLMLFLEEAKLLSTGLKIETFDH